MSKNTNKPEVEQNVKVENEIVPEVVVETPIVEPTIVEPTPAPAPEPVKTVAPAPAPKMAAPVPKMAAPAPAPAAAPAPMMTPSDKMGPKSVPGTVPMKPIVGRLTYDQNFSRRVMHAWVCISDSDISFETHLKVNSMNKTNPNSTFLLAIYDRLVTSFSISNHITGTRSKFLKYIPSETAETNKPVKLYHDELVRFIEAGYTFRLQADERYIIDNTNYYELLKNLYSLTPATRNYKGVQV